MNETNDHIDAPIWTCIWKYLVPSGMWVWGQNPWDEVLLLLLFVPWCSSLSDPEYYQTCDMYIRWQGGMWLKTLFKNVIFTVKSMVWMSTHEPAPLWTLQVWEHWLVLLASYSMFGLLKGSMSFGGSVFSRMGFEIFGHDLLLFWLLQ